MSQPVPFSPEHLAREMETLDRRFDTKANFELFLEFSYCVLALRTALGRERTQALTSRHTRLLQRYGVRKALVSAQFDELFTKAARSIVGSEEDFLGKVFMLLGCGDGVAYSPADKARTAAEISQENFAERVKTRAPMGMGLPNCGSGALPLNAARVIRGMGQDPEKCLFVVATDTDPRCFKMTFIQLTLMKIPALVIHADLAKRKEFDRVVTRSALRQNVWLDGRMSDFWAMSVYAVAEMVEFAMKRAIAGHDPVVPEQPTPQPSRAESSSVEGSLQLGGEAEGVFIV